MKKYLGVTIIFLLVIFSIFLWYLRMPLVERFFDFNTTTTSLGEISGLVGMNLLLVTIILSGRFKFLEKYFGGLNKIYFWHHFLGGLALLFLLVHPIVLVLKYIKLSLYSAAMFLLPMTSGESQAKRICGIFYRYDPWICGIQPPVRLAAIPRPANRDGHHCLYFRFCRGNHHDNGLICLYSRARCFSIGRERQAGVFKMVHPDRWFPGYWYRDFMACSPVLITKHFFKQLCGPCSRIFPDFSLLFGNHHE